MALPAESLTQLGRKHRKTQGELRRLTQPREREAVSFHPEFSKFTHSFLFSPQDALLREHARAVGATGQHGKETLDILFHFQVKRTQALLLPRDWHWRPRVAWSGTPLWRRAQTLVNWAPGSSPKCGMVDDIGKI